MIESSIYIFIGLVLLAGGGELLVRSASKIALTFGVSPLVIGLTIVAFGTSAPELGVSLFAAINGNPEIALTNVVGSNIFNIGFILGLCAIISPLLVNLQLIKFDVPVMIIVSGLTYIFCKNDTLSQIEGLGLFAGTFIYSARLIRASKKERSDVIEEFAEATRPISVKKIWPAYTLVFASIGILVVGSKLLVSGATNVATHLGVSSTLIGLTIVAAGTSLPEVATSIMATLRGQTDIAIGNVIGSNIFNLLLVLGLSSGINSGLRVDASLIKFDLLVMVGMAILSFPFLVTAKRLVRWEGLVLFAAYIAYTFYLIQRG